MSEPLPVEIVGEPVPVTGSAKTASRVGMIAACIWIAGLSLLRGLWPLVGKADKPEFGLTVNEIITTGVAIAAVFTPIFLSIALDKIVEMIRGRAP